MAHNGIVLKVVLPFEILLEQEDIDRLVVETTAGCMGILPLRLDCVALVVPGILTYAAKGEDERYVAVDRGVLVKTGNVVTVSVQNGCMGADLGQLKTITAEEFSKRTSKEQEMKQTFAKLESRFLRRFMEEVRGGERV